MQEYAVPNMLKICTYAQMKCIHMPKYANNMHKYAKYESMKIICTICTAHFSDVLGYSSLFGDIFD